jgi:hypothetical protein
MPREMQNNEMYAVFDKHLKSVKKSEKMADKFNVDFKKLDFFLLMIQGGNHLLCIFFSATMPFSLNCFISNI